MALAMTKTKAPTMVLSKLNSMAFGLAVYASQRRLPDDHARLASSCWSGSTGRDSHPQGSVERFQSCELHLILLSQAFLAQSMQPATVQIPRNSGRWVQPNARSKRYYGAAVWYNLGHRRTTRSTSARTNADLRHRTL